MYKSTRDEDLQRLLDKEEIYEAICRYARGVDRGVWFQLPPTPPIAQSLER